MREQLAHFAYDLFWLNETIFAPFPLLAASSLFVRMSNRQEIHRASEEWRAEPERGCECEKDRASRGLIKTAAADAGHVILHDLPLSMGKRNTNGIIIEYKWHEM